MTSVLCLAAGYVTSCQPAFTDYQPLHVPPPQRNPVPSHPLCPMSSVSAWSTAAAVPKYDSARHTRVSRHFCICGADLESWVHCVVHIFYPFWPNWMEGNKGIPACPKYPSLPDLGLAGKPMLSELLYKLVPSTYIIEKNACM